MTKHWKTATAHPFEVVATMNQLESDGYTVEHAFPVSVEQDGRTIAKVFVAASKPAVKRRKS